MRSMLDGIRVVEFANTVAGPGCTFFLADMGAEVIKVERPGIGDEARLFPPYKDGTSASFAVLNRGKRGVVLDLKDPRAVEVFKELVANEAVMDTQLNPEDRDASPAVSVVDAARLARDAFVAADAFVTEARKWETKEVTE